MSRGRPALLQDFANNVGEILALFANIVQPRSFDDLKTYGFTDPPPTGPGPILNPDRAAPPG